MAVGKIGVGTAFRWLAEALALCRRYPRVIAGAASLLLLVAMLPTVAQAVVEGALQPSPGVRMGVQALFSILSLFLFPPMVGGFYRLVHGLHQGRPARATDLFAMFQDSDTARRLILANLMFVLISIGVIAGLALAIGGESLLEFLRAMSTLKPGATELPPVPDGLLPLLAALSVLALAIMTAQGLATAQVALTGSRPLPAVVAGFGATLRNFGTFLLFYVPVAVIGFIISMIVVLVVALVMAMLSVLSPALAAFLIVPLALLLVLALYAVMFTFFYFAWRDTLSEDLGEPPLDQIAV